MSGWLIDTLIYTGLLIALVLVLRRPIGRMFGPQIAYTLWALPFLRLLLPPIVLPASYAPVAEPIVAPADVQWVEAAAQLEPTSLPSEPVYFVPASAPVEPAWSWAMLLEVAVLLWAAGALAFLAWRIVSYHRMRRELLAQARPVGEIGKIRLVETPALAAPVAFGVWDKVIALPPLFMAQPDIAARDLAIEHELAHHRGHDLLANFLAQSLLALHWFNPVAWYGWRAMRRDQEAACDARVLNGRSRDERALYAALIADIAAGPRLALAAPMACPVLGERSIIHRLRSLSTLDISMRRRWLGRSLIAAGAFALPLTASISYSAVAQEPDDELPPAAPAEAAPVTPSAPVEAPAAVAPPETVEAPVPRMQRFVMERDENGNPVVRQFSLRREGPWPTPNVAPMPQFQHFEFHGWNPDDPEFEAKMEKWSQDMQEWGEKWGEEYGKYWQEWGEQQREQALEQAGRQREQALAQAERQRERALAQAERQRDQALAQAERQRTYGASSSLRRARESIARNSEMSDDVRREVLENLDQEIERIERGDDN